MPVPHYAKRSLAALTLILAVLTAGCGGDSNAPNAPFDPEGTSSDIGAMEASFDSPAMVGYASAADAISAVLAGSPAAAAVKAAPTKMLVVGGKQGAARYAATVSRAYVKPTGGISPSLSTASTAAILDEHLGVTFIYNVDTDQYEASDLTGAPVDGARFIVYAVNGITGMPIEPLIEVGYADVVTTETASSATVRIELVSAGVTYLDYTVGASGSTDGVNVTVSGFVTNGDDLVNFDLDTHISFSESTTLDYSLTVPTRNGFRIDFEAEVTDPTVTTTLEARGPHGTVTISGSQTTTSGSWEVRVNGELFATITMAQATAPVIAGADGEALTPAELAALQALFMIFVEGFDFMEDLLDPIG
jgi:hypothetical protein